MFQTKFATAWGRPIWLTEFRHAAQKIPISPHQKQIARVTTELHETKAQLRIVEATANDTLKEAVSKWMRFEPLGMNANTKARIEKAVKMYLTDPDKRSLKKLPTNLKSHARPFQNGLRHLPRRLVFQL
jgi:hypothetical protein